MPSRNFAARAGRWSAQPPQGRRARLDRVRADRVRGRQRRRRREQLERPDAAPASPAAPSGSSTAPSPTTRRRRCSSRHGRTRERSSVPRGGRRRRADACERQPAGAEGRLPYARNAGQIARRPCRARDDGAARRRRSRDRRQAACSPRRPPRSARTPTCGSSSSATRAPTRRSRRCSPTTSSKAEMLSIPITLAILVVAFGALVAAGIPLLLALSGVMATLGLVALGSPRRSRSTDSVGSVVLLIGLAVGVDYSLFYLRREREERAAGRAERGRARGRRRDVGPRGAGLRPDRDGRDGRHVPRRRHDVRRRSRWARSSSSASRWSRSLTVLPALLSQARRQRRARPRPVPDAAARRATRRVARAGAPSSTACCAARCVSRRSLAGGAAASRSRVPALGMHTALPGDRLAAAQPADHADLRPHPGGVPRQGQIAGDASSSKADDVDTPAGQAAIARSAQTRARERRRQRPDHGRRLDDGTRRRRSTCRSPATAPTRPRDARSTTLRDELMPGDCRPTLPPARSVGVTGMTAETADFNDADEPPPADRVRVRARRSRSCCCSSRSARS